MSSDPDRQVTNTAVNFGCLTLAAGLLLVPPLILPLFGIYRIGVAAARYSHPAVGIVVSLFVGWIILAALAWLIRSLPPRVAQGISAAYIGSCYTFAIFQRELTTASDELDLGWLLFTFAIFALAGWKIGGYLVRAARPRRTD